MAVRIVGAFVLFGGILTATAQSQGPPPPDVKPFVSVEAGGPTAQVTGMAFSPDGRRLYVAGYDKVVHIYQRTSDGHFVIDPAATLRVPTGPGQIGSLFDLAISPDGKWLAAGGRGYARGEAGFRDAGWIWPSATIKDSQREDQGVIFVWNTETRAVRQLRGHKGIVVGLAFATNAPAGEVPPLLSAAAEGDDLKTGAVFLWDVNQPTYHRYPQALAAKGRQPGLIAESRPGLACWFQGKKLLAGISWPENQELRLWDVATDKTWQATLGRNNQALAVVPSHDLLLTGNFDEKGEGSGEIRAWRVSSDDNLRAEEIARHRIPTKRMDNARLLAAPQVMAVFPSQPGGPPDTAAIAMHLLIGGPQPSRAYELLLLDVSVAKLADEGAEKARLRLWDGDLLQPYIAASGNGEYLAIAGALDKNARVVPLRDLLAQQKPNLQVLRSAGLPLAKAAFVRRRGEAPAEGTPRGVARGLRLSPSGPGNRPPELAFDFDQRTLSAYQPGDWIEDCPSTPDTDLAADTQKAQSRIALTDRQKVTAAALLPARPALQLPLLALAYLERGEPTLRLYNAATGTPLRQCTGHLGAIRYLAFDRDGRFLVSVAEDQTVCIWSLTDLDQVVGKHGLLTGITVRAGAEAGASGRGKLMIGDVDELTIDRANRGKLQSGDIIEKLDLPNRESNLTDTPDSFYARIWPAQPGEEVTLTIRGKGDVRLRIGQAIDERKPLFSLFLIREEAAAGPGSDLQPERGQPRADRWLWIGWSPMGPYEASSRDAESYLGWHFNVLQPDRPTSFAPADQYRDQYVHKGLLQALLDKGNLADALASLPPPSLPPLRLTMLVLEGDQVRAPDEQDQVIVNRADAVLKIRPSGPPLEALKEVMVQLDDEPAVKIDGRQESAWTIPLSLTKRRSRVRVQVQTFEEQPQIVSRSITLRYLPPAPQIAALAIGTRAQEDEACTLTAKVKMEPADRPVKIGLQQNGLRVANLAPTKTPDGWEIKHKLQLLEGVNWITLEAINEGAEEPYLSQESTTATREVVYTKKKVPPPKVVGLRFEAISPAGDRGAATAQAWSVVQGQVVRLSAGRVRLRGEIQAEANLTEARLTDPAGGEAKLLAGFAPGQSRKLAIDEELHLKPGSQELELKARCQDSEPTLIKVPIAFQPPLPHLVVLEPERDVKVTAHAMKVLPLTAELTWPPDAAPCQAEVRLNDRILTTLNLQPNQRKLEYVLPTAELSPKRNLLQIRLRNQWQAQSDGEERAVFYLRPPRELQLSIVPPKVGDKPFLTASATVKSPADLPLTPANVRAAINGRAHPARVTKDAAAPAEPGIEQWRIELRDMALKEGDNLVTLVVSNAEGENLPPVSLPSARQMVPYVLPPKPPERATVEWQEPTESQVTRPQLEVVWRVGSTSPVRRVAVLVEGMAADAVPPKSLGTGGTTMRQTVTLAPGLNRVRIEVENDGGLQTEERLINYVPRPVRLELRDVRGAAKSPNGRWLANDKAVTVTGDIVWDRPQSRAELAKCQLNVFANGFLQTPPVLSPDPQAPDTRRTFTAQVLLTEKQNNHIVLQSNIAFEEDQTVLSIDCSQPDDRVRLRLLVVSDKPDDRQVKGELEARVRAALAEHGKGFEIANVKTLVGFYVLDESLFVALQGIQEQMAADLTGGGAQHNELLVVYYQGHELFNEQKGLCWTTDQFNNHGRRADDLLTCTTLESGLRKNCPGARLVLLDVARDRQYVDRSAWERIDSWSNGVAVLRLVEEGGTAVTSSRLLGAWNDAAQRARRLKDLSELLDAALQSPTPSAAPSFWKKVTPPLRFLPVAGGS